MKRVFLDVNVFFDYLKGREPFYYPAWEIVTLAVHKDIVCGVSPNCFPHAFHEMKKDYPDWNDLKHRYAMLRKVVDCGTLDGPLIDIALSTAKPNDLEDAIILRMAEAWSADYLLTRNKRGFPKSTIKIMTPKEFLAEWEIK